MITWMKKKTFSWLIGTIFLAILGLWHLNDVRLGARECGDTWLIGNYLLLLAVVLAGTALCGWFLLGEQKKRQRKLEEIYFLAGTFLGVLYLLVLPPLSAPDEISHYISAYQLSSHMLGQPSNSEDGHVLVRARDWFLEDVYGEYVYDDTERYPVRQGLRDGSDEGTVLGEPLVEQTYRLIHDTFQNGQANRQQEGLVVSSYPPVVTTPAAFFPQAVGISLARLLALDSLWLAYLVSATNLLFFVFMTGLAMKRLPFGKEVLFGVALLPMTLHLAASFSYDVWIMAWIFYFTACCLDLAFVAERVRNIDVAVLAAAMALAGPCKMVYVIFMGLCLLIPIHKFGSWKKWLVSGFCVLSAWTLVMVFVNGQTVSTYVIPETENIIGWAEEPGYSLGTFRHQTLKCLQLIFNTIMWQGEQYHLTMIGAYLGNLDPILDVPYVLVILFTGCLITLSLRKPGEQLVLTGRNRFWIWTLCLGCTGAIMLSMMLAWTPISSKVIQGVQGRYFLPFLPVLLMSLKNDTLVLTREGNRKTLYMMCSMNAYVLLRIYGIVSMRL